LIVSHLTLWFGTVMIPLSKRNSIRPISSRPVVATLSIRFLCGAKHWINLLAQVVLRGIIVTNGNHYRESASFAAEFSAPVFGHGEVFHHKPLRESRIINGDKICDGLTVIGIGGAARGEIALHYAPDGGTLMVGDALINFRPYGFTFLPGKYCSNEREMRRSLRRLLDYKAERILFAHGTPILSGASDRLKSLLGADV
jgi:glyoxylase-like metal-dependent hydrolase (beta-lactamase superfamily II)